jgi:2-phospho-L-lactate guanylyltransferase
VISAIVPAKALDQAKGRLAALLSEDERRALALAMLEDVVRALRAVEEIGSVTVISPDAEVLEVARRLDANALAEPANIRGINQALSFALESVSPQPEAVVVVLADVPLISSDDVRSALRALPERGLAICPSHDNGTSLLGVRPPTLIPFRFGPKSFSLHKREAAARGVPAEVVRIDALARDIDTPDDLRELAQSGQAADTASGRLLERLRILERA